MDEFLRSHDFLKLGQAISHENYQIASMTAARMLTRAKELEDSFFIQKLTMLRQCINTKNKEQALNILSLIINRRAQLLNQPKP